MTISQSRKKPRDKIMQKINEWRMTMRFLNYLHVYTRSRDSNIGSTFEICKRSSWFLKVKQSQMNLELCLVLWKSVDRHAHYYFFLPRLLSIFTVQIQYNQYSKSLRSSPASLFRQNEHFATKKTLNTPPRGCDLGYCHPFTGRA